MSQLRNLRSLWRQGEIQNDKPINVLYFPLYFPLVAPRSLASHMLTHSGALCAWAAVATASAAAAPPVITWASHPIQPNQTLLLQNFRCHPSPPAPAFSSGCVSICALLVVWRASWHLAIHKFNQSSPRAYEIVRLCRAPTRSRATPLLACADGLGSAVPVVVRATVYHGPSRVAAIGVHVVLWPVCTHVGGQAQTGRDVDARRRKEAGEVSEQERAN